MVRENNEVKRDKSKETLEKSTCSSMVFSSVVEPIERAISFSTIALLLSIRAVKLGREGRVAKRVEMEPKGKYCASICLHVVSGKGAGIIIWSRSSSNNSSWMMRNERKRAIQLERAGELL